MARAVTDTVGSLQGATDAMLKHKRVGEEGLRKMQEKDEQLGANRVNIPVGSGSRYEKRDAL